MIKNRVVVVFGLVACLIFSSIGTVSAAPQSSDIDFLGQYGSIVDPETMETVEGELHPVVVGAVVGGIGGLAYYATSSGEKDLKGAAKAAAIGVGVGVVAGAFATAALVAGGPTVAVSKTSAFFQTLGAAHTGALTGAAEQIDNQLSNR